LYNSLHNEASRANVTPQDLVALLLVRFFGSFLMDVDMRSCVFVLVEYNVFVTVK